MLLQNVKEVELNGKLKIGNGVSVFETGMEEGVTL